ncbi:hypothetical protein LCGC14_1948740 [marine sediment metagenome]|uniref:Uncharacterized protein n=1 Tax=marine sediment metagenome TaxID=412755 RepID=A0A0F9FID7_9ZZZZ
MPQTSWKDMLAKYSDTIISCTLTDEEMAKEFDDGYGGSEGASFTAWSKEWVYFPVVYDGAEWIGRAPRDICDHSCGHVGGE